MNLKKRRAVTRSNISNKQSRTENEFNHSNSVSDKPILSTEQQLARLVSGIRKKQKLFNKQNPKNNSSENPSIKCIRMDLNQIEEESFKETEIHSETENESIQTEHSEKEFEKNDSENEFEENDSENDFESDDDEDLENIQDHFVRHFSDSRSESLLSASVCVDALDYEMDADEHPLLGRILTASLRHETANKVEIPSADTESIESENILTDLKVKKRIADLWSSLNGKLVKKTKSVVLTPLQRVLFPIINSYTDMFFANPSEKYEKDICNMMALHILNHVYKTRDRILKDSAKLKAEAASNKPSSDLRDQGFTRPTVLVLLPFRNNALQLVQALIQLSGTKVQANKKRFMDEFGLPAEQDVMDEKKSDEYKHIFAGNIDDCFRVGIKFSRKHMKLFSGFYGSDVIIASPLGLKMIVGSDGDKKREYDFLSSIEILVLGNAELFLMQNWEHVETVFELLNKIPNESHGCDFSRVKSYALDGRGKYVRQTVLFARYFTPEMNGLISRSCNVDGRMKLIARYSGAINKVVSQVPQFFQRIEGEGYEMMAENRFRYFVERVLGKRGGEQKRTMIVVPSYFDFVRLRNYMRANVYNAGYISEYSSRSEADRTRNGFAKGEKEYVVVTERYHFFRRHVIGGVRQVIFYQAPSEAGVYVEIVQMVGREGGLGEGRSVVLYSRYDKMRMERIVGTERVERMQKRDKETFMFSF